MKVIRSVDVLPASLEGSVVAIGNFDGVHKGHQAVLKVALEQAEIAGVPASVMTFEPHPRQFFSPEKKMFRLTDEIGKNKIFEKLGLDLAVVLPFDKALASLSAEDFVRRILVEGLKVSHVVTGFDFFFGKDRQGSPEKMDAFGRNFGFGVSIVEAKRDETEVYSSSRIRACLRDGDVRNAARMLGYWWYVSGVVEPGTQRGRAMGFPTINLPYQDGQDLRHGIYAAGIVVDGTRYQGAAYFGLRPTFESGSEEELKLEAYLFDFDGDLYGKQVTVEFIQYLRADQAFADSDALAVQIKADCVKARDVLKQLTEDEHYLDPRLSG